MAIRSEESVDIIVKNDISAEFPGIHHTTILNWKSIKTREGTIPYKSGIFDIEGTF